MAGFDFIDKELYGEEAEEASQVNSDVTVTDTGYRLFRKVYNTKDGKRYWLYFAEGQLHGHRAEINFTTKKKDPVAYSQIAYIFDFLGEKTIPIYMEESAPEINGEKVQLTNFFVGFSDKDDLGGEIKVVIKPKNESDKTFWNYFIARFKKKRELESAAQSAEGGDVNPETPPVEKPEKKNKA